MESLSMLKQWRASTTKQSRSTTTTTIASTILQEDDDGDGDDEGPFIDLEFSVPDEDADKNSDDDDPAALRADSNLSLSPDDLFFKGRLIPSETSSLVFSTSESNPKPQFPVSLLKSKFRVFMLGSKKTKTSISDISGATASPKHQQHNINNSSSNNNKLFVRFKVEEVPLVSLFTRDNSSKSSKLHSENGDTVATEDKKFSKEVLQRYLSKIKRLRFSGQLGSVSSVSKPGSDGNPPPGLKPVHRRLGKSRSASATVAAVRSPPRRRDDSLLQQQDGIQSAIAHCKRSFNADKEPEPSLLVRSNSDPGNGRPETRSNEAEAKVDLH
ncbi:hypothetical protein J5N97_004606 [Dioscorea zingiberensis]|uniref:Membrane-associated kinase regulator 2 n=1 Tax=Dioscorea zingiberensis TaxID=325984 RepID=A0A9D5HR49_9LILI|nr:hypothetical protein J5N97_004606 [Dioscorea zingiberensis]